MSEDIQRVCPECGGKILDNADSVAGYGDVDEIWWNYRCEKCGAEFQELPAGSGA